MQHMPHVSTSARIITQDAFMTYTIYPRPKPATSNIELRIILNIHHDEEFRITKSFELTTFFFRSRYFFFE